MSEKYDFVESLQIQIVAMLLFDNGAFVKYRDIVVPAYFENPVLKELTTLIIAFFEKYSRVPIIDELLDTVDVFLSENPKLPKEEYLKVLEELYERAEENFEYIRDKVIQFAQDRAMEAAVRTSVQLLRKRDFMAIRKEVEIALEVGKSTEDLGTFYFDKTEERIKARTSGELYHFIPTALPSLDKYLRGGLPRTRLGIIMGPAKRGKTITLVCFAAGAIAYNYNVLHVFMEGGTEDIISEYYDVKFSGIPFLELKDQGEVVQQEVENTRKNYEGQLVLKHFYANQCSAWMIESYLQQLKARTGFVPDLIVVDYLGLMRPSDKQVKYNSKYEMLGDVTKELVSLAQRGDYALWLGHQSTRGSFKKARIDMDDSGDSILPMQDADIIITLNKDKDDPSDEDDPGPKWMQFFIAGGRFCRDRRTLKIIMEKNLVRITDREEGV